MDIFNFVSGSLTGIPIRNVGDLLGPGPFCKLMPNYELNLDWSERRVPGEYILCNQAGFEILDAEIKRRNAVMDERN